MTSERIFEIYDSEEFFNIVKINPDFENFYLKHENDFEWNIVTKGHKSNIEHNKNISKSIFQKRMLLDVDLIRRRNRISINLISIWIMESKLMIEQIV